jgi:hypothetical protein
MIGKFNTVLLLSTVAVLCLASSVQADYKDIPQDLVNRFVDSVDGYFSCSRFSGVAPCYYKKADKRDVLAADCANEGKVAEKWEYDFWLGGECFCYRCVNSS